MSGVALRRLFRVVNGGTPTSEASNWGGGIDWATPVDLGRVHGGHLRSTDRTLTQCGLRSGSASVPAHSLIISTRAPIGYVAETTAQTAFNQGCKGLIPIGVLDIRFYRYALVSMSSQLQMAGQGSTFVELSGDSLAEQRVPAPSLPMQRLVADFLDTETARIDALITKKRRMIDLARLRLLVYANDLTRTGPALAARRVLDGVKTGTTPGGDDADLIRDDADLEWVSPADIAWGLRLLPAVRWVDALALHRGLVPRFPAGSVLIVGIGATAGRVAFVDREVTGNQQITCLVPNPLMEARFLAWQLFARSEELRGTAPFTTLPILNNEFLRSLHLYAPSVHEQRERAALLDAHLATEGELEALLARQVALLQEHRQALIIAAVTGELEVPGVAA